MRGWDTSLETIAPNLGKNSPPYIRPHVKKIVCFRIDPEAWARLEWKLGKKMTRSEFLRRCVDMAINGELILGGDVDEEA